MRFAQQLMNGWYGQLLRHPIYRWVVILGTIVYLVSPIDLSPDLIPLLGQVDDVVVITLLISTLFRVIGTPPDPDPPSEAAQHPEASAGSSQVIDVDAVSLD
jgi:uncharacterized membrane protein YkvA (DUF1232 family)